MTDRKTLIVVTVAAIVLYFGVGNALIQRFWPSSAVVFNGYTLHGSFPNRTPNRFRRSIQFVYMRA